MPRFIYFDLGNVLLYFDHAIACQKMASVAGITAELVRQIVYEKDLGHRYERGDVTSTQFYEHFCLGTSTQPAYSELYVAAADMFEVNESVLPVIDRLLNQGAQLGILSNTCESHWDFCLERFPLVLNRFRVHALSFKLNRMKPEPEIYIKAAKLAGVAPEEIFFTDDRIENVEGALAAGYQATLFQGAAQLVEDLKQVGIII